MAQVKPKHHKPPAEWYICGGYVLDVLFSVRVAKDIDVCWLSTCMQPTNDEVLAWIDSQRLHRTPCNPAPTRVQQLDYPEAGGFPSLNIHCWRLERNGQVCAVDPETSEKSPLTADNAPQVQIIRRPVPADRAKKALEKMAAIPQLDNPAIHEELKHFASRADEEEDGDQ